jgi:hypothetical protein
MSVPQIALCADEHFGQDDDLRYAFDKHFREKWRYPLRLTQLPQGNLEPGHALPKA